MRVQPWGMGFGTPYKAIFLSHAQMNNGLSTLTTDHIVISSDRLLQEPPPELDYRGYGECPGLWEYVDSSICTLSTLQPLSLNYTAINPPLLLDWVHHWTSLTALQIDYLLDISHSVNELLLALTELRTLNLVLHYHSKNQYTPSPLSNLRGLTKLESLNIEAVLLDMNLGDLNLRQLVLDLSTVPLLEDSSKGETDMTFLLDSFRHMTALKQLELIRIDSRWTKRLMRNIPPNLKELRFDPSSVYDYPPEVLDELLFALPPGLHLFDTKLDLKSAPRYLEWIESWSGMWTKSPIDRYAIQANVIEPLSRAYSKCTQLTFLALNLHKIDDGYIAPLQHLFTNATHFRELHLKFHLPNNAMMTTLSTLADHACHLTTLYLSLIDSLPTRFFDLRFPELQHLILRSYIKSSQWPLLRHFLEEHKQLKSLRVELNDLNAPEAAQQLWTLFPPSLDTITVGFFYTDVAYPYFEQLPNYLGQSQWRKLFISCAAPFPPDFTLPPTALWIEKLHVGGSSIPGSLKTRLATNKKRNQSLEVLASPAKAPLWCTYVVE